MAGHENLELTNCGHLEFVYKLLFLSDTVGCIFVVCIWLVWSFICTTRICNYSVCYNNFIYEQRQ